MLLLLYIVVLIFGVNYCQAKQHFLKNNTPELTVKLGKLMLLLKTLESTLVCPLNKLLNRMKPAEEGCAVILH